MARPQPPFEQRLRIPGSNVRNHGLYRSHLPDAQSSYRMKLLKHPLKNDGKDVDLVVARERKKVKPRLLFSPHSYRFVAYELTGDRHTQSGWSSGALAVWE